MFVPASVQRDDSIAAAATPGRMAHERLGSMFVHRAVEAAGKRLRRCVWDPPNGAWPRRSSCQAPRQIEVGASHGRTPVFVTPSTTIVSVSAPLNVFRRGASRRRSSAGAHRGVSRPPSHLSTTHLPRSPRRRQPQPVHPADPQARCSGPEDCPRLCPSQRRPAPLPRCSPRNSGR